MPPRRRTAAARAALRRILTACNRDVVLVGLLVLAGTAYREPFAFAHPQFWAEDGPVFFAEAFTEGWRAFLQPYAGYLHLYPRAIAALAVHLPIQSIPAVFLAGNVMAQMGVAWLCLSPRLPMSRWAKIAAGAAVALAPAQNEVFNKLVNSQWILGLMLLLIIALDPPRTRRQAIGDGALLALGGLTGPFSVIFLPLFLAQGLLRRSRHSWELFGVALLCALLQLRHLEFSRTKGTLAWSVDFLRSINGVFGHMVAGTHGRPAPAGMLVNLAISGLAVLATMLIAYGALRHRRWISLVFLAGGIGVIAATMYAFKYDPTPLVGGGDRYWYIPTVAFTWAVIGLWDATAPPSLRIAIVSVLALMVASFLQDPHSLPAAAFDEHWEVASRCIGREHPCVIPVNPGWTFSIP
jgi:hypothetical protein